MLLLVKDLLLLCFVLFCVVAEGFTGVFFFLFFLLAKHRLLLAIGPLIPGADEYALGLLPSWTALTLT